jgi:antitoxin HicB
MIYPDPTSAEAIEKILARPYCYIILPDDSFGLYSGFIPDFPGCVSAGETPEEALTGLFDSARSWLAVVLERGQEVPEAAWYRKIPGLEDM